jgi:hypothetical protein
MFVLLDECINLGLIFFNIMKLWQGIWVIWIIAEQFHYSCKMVSFFDHLFKIFMKDLQFAVGSFYAVIFASQEL